MKYRIKTNGYVYYIESREAWWIPWRRRESEFSEFKADATMDEIMKSDKRIIEARKSFKGPYKILKHVTQLILLISSLSVMACASPQKAATGVLHHKQSKIARLCRVTYYVGRRTATGVKPVQGKTIAAHPKHPFGQKIEIPQLYKYLGETKFEVQDRGSAVTKYDRIDVFVKNRKTMNWLKNDAPEWMEVIEL